MVLRHSNERHSRSICFISTEFSDQSHNDVFSAQINVKQTPLHKNLEKLNIFGAMTPLETEPKAD